MCSGSSGCRCVNCETNNGASGASKINKSNRAIIRATKKARVKGRPKNRAKESSKKPGKKEGKKEGKKAAELTVRERRGKPNPGKRERAIKKKFGPQSVEYKTALQEMAKGKN